MKIKTASSENFRTGGDFFFLRCEISEYGAKN